MPDFKNIKSIEKLSSNASVVAIEGGQAVKVPVNALDELLSASSASLQPPKLASTSPADGATDVASDASYSLTFDKTIYRGEGNIYFIDQATGRRISIPVSNPQLVGISTNSATNDTVTVSSGRLFAAGASYTVNYDKGIVVDERGLYCPPLLDNTTANFTIEAAEGGGDPVDTTAPVQQSITPAASATDVAIDANIVLTFNEAVVWGTGNAILRNVTDSTDEATIAAEDAQFTISGDGLTVTLNLGSDLDNEKEYALAYPEGFFADAAGNDVAAYNLDYSETFTTVAAALSLPVFNTSPSITGIAWTGGQLAVDISGATGHDSVAYQWKIDDVDDVTTATFDVAAADEGAEITCAVTLTNTDGDTTETTAGVTIVRAVQYIAANDSNNTYTTINRDFATTDVDTGNNRINITDLDLNRTAEYVATKMRFSSTGTLPAPLQPDTDYYVHNEGSPVAGIAIYPVDDGKTAAQFGNGYLDGEYVSPAESYSLGINRIVLTDQGTGTHTMTSQELVTGIHDKTGRGYDYTKTQINEMVERRQDANDNYYIDMAGVVGRDINDPSGPFYGKLYAMTNAGTDFGDLYSGNRFLAMAGAIAWSKDSCATARRLAIEPGDINTGTGVISMTNHSMNGKKVRFGGYSGATLPTGWKAFSGRTIAPADVNTTSGVITDTAHGFATGDHVVLRSPHGNTLPAGFSEITYWVNAADANSFTLHTSSANASAGTSPVIPTDQGTNDFLVEGGVYFVSASDSNSLQLHPDAGLSGAVVPSDQGSGMFWLYETARPLVWPARQILFDWNLGSNDHFMAPVSTNPRSITNATSQTFLTGGNAGRIANLLPGHNQGGDQLGSDWWDDTVIRVQIFFPPETKAPIRTDTSQPLTSGIYYMTKPPAGDRGLSDQLTRLHDTLEDAEHCLNNTLTTSAAVTAGRAIGLEADSDAVTSETFSIQALDFTIIRPFDDSPTNDTTFKLSELYQRKAHAVMVDFNDTSLNARRWYMSENGVLWDMMDSDTSETAGVIGASTNDSNILLGNAAQPHVPGKARIYEVGFLTGDNQADIEAAITLAIAHWNTEYSLGY